MPHSFLGLTSYKDSKVLIWSRNTLKRDSHSLDLKHVVAMMIRICASFGTQFKESKFYIYKKYPYLCDSTVFEMSCYLLFHTHVWLLTHEKSAEENAITGLRSIFSQIFDYSLGIPNTDSLLRERIIRYSEVKDSENPSEEQAKLLASLVRYSRNNNLPSSLEGLHQSLMEDTFKKFGVFDIYEMEMALHSWESNMVPAYLELLKNYYQNIRA